MTSSGGRLPCTADGTCNKTIVSRRRIVTLTEKSSLPAAAAFPIAIIVSALSTLSLLVFHYLRTCEDAVSYYTDTGKSLLQDALHTSGLWMILLAALLLGFCHFQLMRRYRQGLRAGWLTSLPLAFNMIISLSMEHSELREIFLPGSSGFQRLFVNTVIFIGFAALLSCVITVLYGLLDRGTAKPIDTRLKLETQIGLFAIAYILIFAGWVPSLVLCFPGSLDMDALNQIKSFMGLVRIDAANPILTTLFYGWMFKMGRVIGQNDALSFFKIVLLQDVFNAGFMALVCVRTRQYTKSNLAYFFTIVFFSLMPMWQRAAQHVLKDVFHTGWYLAFYLAYLSCLEKERVSTLDAAILCFCCIMISFTRSAVFYIAVIALVVLFLAKNKGDRIRFVICIALVVSLFFGVEKGIYPRFEKRIKPPREQERYSMQMQQIALYCIEYGDELSEDEIRIINGTLDYETIVRDYTPMISDPVKSTWHGTDEDHNALWALYRSFILRHPSIMLKGILMSSFEHFNPWFSGNRNGVSMSKDPDFHQVDYADLQKWWRMVKYWNSWLDHPVSRVFYGNGLYAWILIMMIGYAVKCRSLRAVLGMVPHIVLMIGLFMSHVNGLLRYGYPLIAATPLICAYTFYAVSQKQPAVIDAPTERAQTRMKLLSGAAASLRPVSDRLTRRIKKMIRNICYYILNRTEDKK